MQTRKSQILYVEDHLDTSDLIRLVLEQRNYDVTIADSIESALRLIDQHAFDLYLLDSRLPDGLGVDLCKHLRTIDSLTPIIFYSAAAYEVDRNTAMESGAQGYLVKPTANGELARMVGELLAQAKERKVNRVAVNS